MNFMNRYLSILVAGMMGASCGKSMPPSPLEQQLASAKEVGEILPTGFSVLHYVDGNNKVVGSLLSGNGKYVVFHDLDHDGKVGVNDYCSVNEFQLCDESPAWGVPQLNNVKRCAVNICSTHYPSTLSSLQPSKVRPQLSPNAVMELYTDLEMRDIHKIAPMSAEQINQCPALCESYFRGSQKLAITLSLI